MEQSSGNIELLLASFSPIRQQLLREARIAFKSVGHSFDETLIDQQGHHGAVVKMLAQCKARSVNLDTSGDADAVIVVAADTLVADSNGVLFGKPRDYDHAVEVLKQIRGGARVVTGVCCRRLERRAKAWVLVSERCEVVGADVQLDLPDAWIPVYLSGHKDFLFTAGALAVEGFGAQFVKGIQGSYTAVLGLPMVEVRLMLEELGFFDLPLF
ncbi:MAG: Nucleotide-binding protein implicated in inhibition of septum formation [candidate division TM6 bacterium GW2011_GWF2_43_87]|nr:MAG: Nucleotide-binding protein implicated in inhibition of septum formation [candidate division TM6 bacterium GW2011_GWF2_43_87]